MTTPTTGSPPAEAEAAPRRPWNDSDVRLTFIAGLVFAGAVTAVYSALWELRVGPNPTFDLVDLLIDYSPGALATWAIENLGPAGKVSITVSGIALWMVVSGLIAAGVRVLAADAGRGRLVTYSAGAYLLLTLVVTLPVGIDSGSGLLALLATAIGWGYLAHRFVRPPGRSNVWRVPLERPPAPGRRRLLQVGAVTAAVLTAGGLGIEAIGRSRREEQVLPVTPPAATPVAAPGEDTALVGAPARDGTAPKTAAVEETVAFVAAPFTRPAVTANEDFYTINVESRAPNIGADDWRLSVSGLVENELFMTYDELLEVEPLEYHGTLQCISNEVGGDLISTTRWQGVPMRSVIELAGPVAGAVDVVLVAIGGYSDSIPLAKALEDETLLAYSMNGRPLPSDHGFPIRAYIPNIYGMKNVKWLSEIKLVDSDFQGYWQRRGWSDDATIKTTSAIDLPERRNNAEFARGPLEVGGIAFAGNRGIGEVEYRVDGEGLWVPAALEQPLSTTTWRRWKAGLDLEPGRHELEVRAVDGQGGAQQEEETNTHPDGAGGYHKVSIRIEP